MDARGQARRLPGRVVLWYRYATDYSDTFLRIAEAVRALPVAMALPAHLTQAITAHGVLLDGEAIVFRPDRHSDFCGAENEQGRGSGVLRRP